MKKIKISIKKLYFRLFWFQRIINSRVHFKFNIRRKIKNNLEVKNTKKDKLYLKESKEFLKKYFNGYKNTNWHFYYSSFNQLKQPNYIPDELYFPLIEPTLNKNKLQPAYTDKNSYDFYFKKTDLPETIVKLVNGYYFDDKNNWIPKTEASKKLLEHKKNLVFKPAIQSGAGKNIIIDSPTVILDYLKNNKYEKASYVIQKRIEQHQKMAQFHPMSVNTCRLITARIDSEIVVLSAYFRMGRNESRIDNGMAGGIMCGIDKNGKITDFAIDALAKKMYVHPNSKIPFNGFEIPAYSDVREFCTKYHKKFLHYTLISWDIAISKNGKPVCIELNLQRQAIFGHQLLNGPLFGEYTDYLLKKYRKDYKKNFNFL